MIHTDQPTVACIGAGHWGANLVRNFHELKALALICDSDGRRLKAARAQYPDVACIESFNTVLADTQVGAVAIATPAETHGALIRQALLAGKDVFVEKPLCLEVEEGRSLLDLASAQQRILMVGHLLWYHPAILKLKQLIEDGELGRIRYIYSNRLNLGMIRREENILWSFAPHDISVILGLIGEMPDHVEAHGGNYLHDRIADVTVSLLSFPSGIKAHVFVSWLHPYKEQKLIVVGERQMAVFDDVASDHKLVLYPHVILWKGQMPVPNKAKGRPVPIDKLEPLRAECEHFLDCLQNRQMPRTSGQEGLRVLTVLQQCQSALADGVPKAPVAAKHATDYFAHPSAFIDEDVEIGAGTSVWHVSHILRNSRVGKDCRIGQNVVIGPNVRVGDSVKIQNNVSVYEGVTLEDRVFCGPSVVFTNVHNPRSEIRRMDEVRPTVVRYGATLGANCTIVCGVTIGRYAFVGAGAVVTKDVPDFALVVGNPARVAGWMCACGNRIKLKESEGDGVCGACQKRYQKIGREVRAA
jgi:UDP-2-acetamido-3-amino-2,3-dideoxy-glucuronate N-acetyltransferase